MTRPPWTGRPARLPFPRRDEVHLFRIALAGELEKRWRGLLVVEERDRADRFRFSKDRHRFTITRGILRSALGQYLEVAPTSLRFTSNSLGKPSLATSPDPRGLTFNVTHSGDWSLLAFGMATDLGVDVEELRDSIDIEHLARDLFAPREYALFLALRTTDRRMAFFRAWTTREAVGKALGRGLSSPLDRAGHLELDEPPAASIVTPMFGDVSGCSLYRIGVHVDYAAALAVKAAHADVHPWDWADRET
jgi:4'-phosphopantetheinyl transferase